MAIKKPATFPAAEGPTGTGGQLKIRIPRVQAYKAVIIVKEIPPGERKRGKLLLAESKTSRRPAQSGIIVSVYQPFTNAYGIQIESKLEVGQCVFFGQFAGLEMEIENEDFLLLQEDQVLAWRAANYGELSASKVLAPPDEGNQGGHLILTPGGQSGKLD